MGKRRRAVPLSSRSGSESAIQADPYRADLFNPVGKFTGWNGGLRVSLDAEAASGSIVRVGQQERSVGSGAGAGETTAGGSARYFSGHHPLHVQSTADHAPKSADRSNDRAIGSAGGEIWNIQLQQAIKRSHYPHPICLYNRHRVYLHQL